MAALLRLLDTHGIFKAEVPDDVVSLYLESLVEHQSLRTADSKDVKAFCGVINASLDSEQTRSRGLEALLVFIGQCDDNDFQEHARGWLQALLGVLKTPSSTSTDRARALQLMAAMLDRSAGLPDLSKQVSSLAPAIVAALLVRVETHGDDLALQCLSKLLSSFPAACGASAAQIERALLAHVRPGARLGRALLCRCFALLPCLGGAGREAANHRSAWVATVNNLQALIADCTQQVFGILPERRSRHQPVATVLRIPKCPSSNLLTRTLFLTEQICVLVACLSELLAGPCSFEKSVSISRLVEMMADVFDVSLAQVSKSEEIECQVVSSVLPRLYASTLRLQGALLNACRQDAACCLPDLFSFCSAALNEATSSYQSGECLLEFEEVKVEAYRCLQRMFTMFGSCCGNLVAKDVVPLILRDIVPFRANLSLAVKATSSRKRKKTASAALATGTVAKSSSPLCLEALRCVSAAFGACGSLLSAQTHKDAQAVVVGLCLEVQREQAFARRQPYSSQDCRLELFRALLALVVNPHPSWPPPLHYAVAVLAQGRLDESARVASFCADSAAACEAVTRPRSATLHWEMATLTPQEVTDIKEALAKVHVVVLQGQALPFAHSHQEQLQRKRAKNDAVNGNRADEQAEAEGAVVERDSDTQTNEDAIGGLAEDDTMEEDSGTAVEEIRDSRVSAGSLRTQLGEDEKREIMNLFYDPSIVPVIIPESVRVAKSVEAAKTPQNPEPSEEKAPDRPKVDLAKAMASFVAEMSDEESE
jgi:hypothetical protein